MMRRAQRSRARSSVDLDAGRVGVRGTLHVEPQGVQATARHYIRDLVYGANDGIITTFAVVAGVAGGQLSAAAALIVGAANLAADGLSMGVGNVLAIRAQESARRAERLPEVEAHPWKHGLATFGAFVGAGALPLAPYGLGVAPAAAFAWSSALTLIALFAVGATRGIVTSESWWRAGLEMLGLGVIVAAAAYAAGALVVTLV
jgi:VIT1/CCC1 family predicted Fe2+/Mn2+ transporter